MPGRWTLRFWRQEGEAPLFLRLRSSETFIILTISIAIFTDIFLYSCIVPVIPFALTTRVHTPQDNVQHQVSVLLAVYGAALLAGSPVCGMLSDRMPNRRLPLLLGLLALAGSTLLLCLGTNMAMLLVGRILQGLSAAVVWTVGLALLADTVGHDGIGQALGYVSISMSLGILVAPLLGGLVYDKAGYYSVYYMCFGMIILDIVLRLLLVEKKVAKQWLPPADTLELQETSSAGPRSPESERQLPSSNSPPGTPTGPDQPSISHTIEDASSYQKAHPLSSLVLLMKSRRLLVALTCSLISAILLTAWDATLPLYVAKLFHWSSIGGGLIFLPLIIPSLLAPLVGWWADKRGPRVPIVLGLGVATPFFVLLRFVDHGGIRQIVLLCALLAMVGIAITLAFTPLEAEITYIVQSKEKSHPGVFGERGAYATAYGLFNTAFAGGMLAGPLWGGLVVQKAGWGTMCWTIALLSFAAAVLAFFFLGTGLNWNGTWTCKPIWRRPSRSWRRSEREDPGGEGAARPAEEA